MCYRNCYYESYPYGPNEGCVCKLPRYATCPLDREDSEDEEHEDEDEYDEGPVTFDDLHEKHYEDDRN